jgi:hypothetical protein
MSQPSFESSTPGSLERDRYVNLLGFGVVIIIFIIIISPVFNSMLLGPFAEASGCSDHQEFSRL